MTRENLLAALEWQVDLGADEAISEKPSDRFAEPETSTARADGIRRNGSAKKTDKPNTAGQGRTAQPAAAKSASGSADPSSSAPPAAELAAGASSLAELQQAVASWDGSELKKGARNCVFADGLPGAHLMIVGEAPGANEDREGKPFVGKAGQLLDRMLAAIGLDRKESDPAKSAYIANILPWRPPGNRTPSEQEAMLFLPFIERHIELAQPKVIFAVGNTPTKALLGTKEGIRRMRGRWRRHGASGLPLLPSFHPAYLFHQPEEKRYSWQDLQALRRVLDGEAPDIEEGQP